MSALAEQKQVVFGQKRVEGVGVMHDVGLAALVFYAETKSASGGIGVQGANRFVQACRVDPLHRAACLMVSRIEQPSLPGVGEIRSHRQRRTTLSRYFVGSQNGRRVFMHALNDLVNRGRILRHSH